MRFNAVVLFLVGACALSSPCTGRQVDLLVFAGDPPAGPDGGISPALAAMMAEAGSPAGRTGESYKNQANGSMDGSQDDRTMPGASPFLPAAGPAACPQARYRPAWWLSVRTELRRAAYYPIMAAIACEHGLSPHLLDAVISQESGYRAAAVSRAGAMGMMQIMPGTARELGLDRPWDALANMRAGARYLRRQLDRFGRPDLALAAYNAGPYRRSLVLGLVPAIPETVHYVRVVTTNWARIAGLQDRPAAQASRAQAAGLAARSGGFRDVSFTDFDNTARAGAF